MIEAGSGNVLPIRIREPLSWFGSAKGLIGQKSLPDGDGLLLQCNGVHTFGMRFAIDVVALDRDGVVTAVHNSFVPNRVIWAKRGWVSTLELGAGVATQLGIIAGSQWRFDEVA